MKRFTKLQIILFMAFFFMSCSSNMKKNGNEKNTNASINQKENFEEFYNKFLEDSLFQKSRISFPLQAILISPPEPDTTGNIPKFDTIHIYNKNNWVLYKKIHFDTTQFIEDHKLMADSSIEVAISGKYFDNLIKRRFKLINNKWFLISVYERYS